MFYIIKAIIAWGIMLIIGINLIGFIVRTLFWSPPKFDIPLDMSIDHVQLYPVKKAFDHEIRRAKFGSKVMALFLLIITAAYLFALYHFWNLGLAVSAGLLMIARLPDLFWELRTGKKVSKSNAPNGAIYILAVFLDILTLPLVWYSLCKWKP